VKTHPILCFPVRVQPLSASPFLALTPWIPAVGVEGIEPARSEPDSAAEEPEDVVPLPLKS
jgi:hypothetical protein